MDLLKLTYWLLILFSFLSLPLCNGQILEIDKLGESQGLSTNNISIRHHSLERDKLGYIWLGNQSGLSRYDGYSFKNYVKISSSDHDIPCHNVEVIRADQDDNLWVGTLYDGVLFYDRKDESFHNLKEFVKDSMPDIVNVTGLMKLENDLYISCFLNGSFKYNLRNHTITPFNFDLNDETGLQIISLDTTSRGELIFNTFSGVVIFNEKGEQENYQNPKNRSYYITEIAELADDRILVEYRDPNDTYIIDRKDKSFNKVAHDKYRFVTDIYRVSDTTLWRVFEHDSIKIINNLGEQIDTVNHAVFEAGNIYISNIKRDISGDLFYTTRTRGAGKIKLESNKFSSVLNNKYQLVKRIGDEIFFYNSTEIYNYTKDSLLSVIPQDVYIFNFQYDADKNLLVSIYPDKSYITTYDKRGNKVDEHMSRLQAQIEVFDDGRVVVDSKDWGGMEEEELNYNSIAEIYEEISGVDYPDYRARYFFQSSNGDIWISTFDKGLIRIFDQGKEFEFMDYDVSGNGKLNNKGIYYIYENDNEEIFFVTERNLNVYNIKEDKFSYLDLEDGDVVLRVLGMVQSKDDKLFCLTNKHIYSINANKEIQKFSIPNKYQPNYTESRDLVDDNDVIYYEGVDGIIKVNKNALEEEREPLDPLVTSLFINRERVYPKGDRHLLDSSIVYQKDIVVKFRDRNVGFEFVSIDGKEIESEYHYKLHGFDEEWKISTSDRIVHYTNIDPGSYSFEVKVRSGNGKWAKKSIVKNLTVLAPWYATKWAYIVYFILISGALYAFYRYRVGQLTRYEMLRTRISSDLHDDVGTLLSSVAMQSEVLSLDAAPEKRERFEKLSNLSREAMGRMRDTVWAIDSRKDNVDSLIDRMQDYLSDMSEVGNLKVHFKQNIGNMTSSLAPDVRQNVYLIFKEAVNNAFKYSNGTQLIIKLDHDRKSLNLNIHDDGIIDPDKIKTSGTGLSNMKMRAKRIGGDLDIDTSDGFMVRLIV